MMVSFDSSKKINNIFNNKNDNNNNNNNNKTIFSLINSNEFLILWQDKKIDDGDSIEFIVSNLLSILINEEEEKESISYENGIDYNNGSGYDYLNSFYNPKGFKPSISITDFTYRLVKYLGCSKSCFIIALIYLDRIIDSDKFRVPINGYNVHRIYFTCILVSIKFFDDYFYPLDIYSRVCGVSLEETSRMERQCIKLLDFNVNINLDQFNDYLSILDYKGFIQFEIENQPSDEENEEENDNEEEEEEEEQEEDEEYQEEEEYQKGIDSNDDFENRINIVEKVSYNRQHEEMNHQSGGGSISSSGGGGGGGGGGNSMINSPQEVPLNLPQRLINKSRITRSDTLVINLNKNNNSGSSNNDHSENNSNNSSCDSIPTIMYGSSGNNLNNYPSRAITIESRLKGHHTLSQSLDSKDVFFKNSPKRFPTKFSISPDLRSKFVISKSSSKSIKK
ncbi:hypothetical protein ACTFIU_005403 [Dictyostelium citrinum]